MPEIKLKPCPFCGSKAELLLATGKMTKWAVRCTKCYANNGTFVSDHDAVEAWNKRAEQPEITLESAIDYLHDIGWMQEHDRIMAESAPVVHAHWNETFDYTGTCYAECSRCGLLWWIEEGTAEENEMFYCPKCGAKMDEGASG